MESNQTQNGEIFFKLFSILCQDFARFKKSLPKSGLTPSQVKILLGFHAYLKGERSLCFERLKAARQEDPFFEGVRHCLLGVAHNYFGQYKFAEEHLLMGESLLSDSPVDYFKILNKTTLFLVYVNRQQLTPLHQLMDELNGLKTENDFLRLTLVMCKALYFQITKNFEKSNKVLQKEFNLRSPRFSSFEVNFIIIRFENHFKVKEYYRCKKDLEDYKKATGFTTPSNYKFMKILFNHILEDAALYVYQSDFSDSVELFEQLMVIKSLSEGQREKALKFWNRLAKHNPEIYQENFSFKGTTSLFAVALEKQLNQKFCENFNPSKLSSLKSLQEKLKYILKFGPDTIKKDQLIEWLWSEESNEKNKARLRKLIHDYHAKYGECLKSNQDSYKKIKSA